MKKQLVVLLAALGAAACDDETPSGVDAGPDAGLDVAAEVGSDAGGDVGGDLVVEAGDGAPGASIPAGSAGVALAWLLDLINGPPAAITAQAVAGHFNEAFLGAVPIAALVELLQGMATDDAPVVVHSVGQGPAAGPGSLTAVVITRHAQYQSVHLTTDASAPALIAGLLIQPAPEHDPDAQSFAAIARRAAAVAARARLYVGRIGAAGCTTVVAAGASEPMPLGSLFKIYVLGAVANRILDGGATPLTWGQELVVDEALKSLPSGLLQNVPAGTKVAIDTAAGQMISISDNTATDHLMALVGRAAVEGIQATMGHAQPALNQPFFTTRELFLLKLGASADERQAFIAAPVPERRRLLAEVYAPRPLPPIAAAVDWTAPRDVDTLEWFGSAEDVCRGFAWLGRQAQRPGGAPILQILSKNPGAPVDKSVWGYTGFKGGSEPGVLALGWLLRRRADDAWFNVTLGFSDPVKMIDDEAALYFALALLQLAGR